MKIRFVWIKKKTRKLLNKYSFIRKKYINDEGFKHVKQESGFSIYDTKDKFEDYEYITSV